MIVRLWIFTTVKGNRESFLRFRRDIQSYLNCYAKLQVESIQYALINADPLKYQETKDLQLLHDVSYVQMQNPCSNEKAILHGLRKLRGTIREEDIILCLEDDINYPNFVQLIEPVLEDFRNHYKIVLQQSKANTGILQLLTQFFQPKTQNRIAIFRGWFVQFKIEHAMFDYSFFQSFTKTGLPLINTIATNANHKQKQSKLLSTQSS